MGGQASIIRTLQDLFREAFFVQIESADTDLFETGVIDSLTLVTLILRIEQHFGIRLPMEALSLESLRSLRALAGLLAG